MKEMNFYMPVVALAVNILFQLILLHLNIVKSLLKSVVLSFAFGMVFLLSAQVIFFWEVDNFLSILLMSFFSYGFLGYCYFGFLGLIESARRTTILRAIDSTVAKSMTEDEIFKKRSAKSMLDLRISRLLVKKQLIKNRERLFIGRPIVLYMSNLVILMKRIMLGKESEFD